MHGPVEHHLALPPIDPASIVVMSRHWPLKRYFRSLPSQSVSTKSSVVSAPAEVSDHGEVRAAPDQDRARLRRRRRAARLVARPVQIQLERQAGG